MKVKMSKVLELNRLYEKVSSQTLPIKLTYKVTKFFAPVLSEHEFYQKELAKILDACAVKDENDRPKPTEDGTGVQIKPECMGEVQEKLSELIDLEVDLTDITFKLDELEKIEMSVEDFSVLMPFIEEEGK